MISDETDVAVRARKLQAENAAFVLATVVRSEAPTSAKPGAKALVDGDGVITGWIGGGCAQPAAISTARKVLQDGQPRLIRVSPGSGASSEVGIVDFTMACHSGGVLDIFLEPYAARPSLLIVGDSPVARALSGLAHRTGLDVYVAFPQVDAAIYPDARQALGSLDLVDLACGTPRFVVVATQGRRDEEGLEAALASGSSYIAFVASRRKAEKLRLYLQERGHDPERVNAIVAPAGVRIGAVTPEEIALSVLAGLVSARRAHDGERPEPDVVREGVRSGEEGHAVSADTVRDPVCGMSVQVAAAEYRSQYQGREYYFCCCGCQHSFEKNPASYLQEAASSP